VLEGLCAVEERLRYILVEQRLQVNSSLFVESPVLAPSPGSLVGSPLRTSAIRNVKDTCPGYSGWCGESEISDLKDHFHVRLQRDTLV